jgi:hypothetical protein
LIASGVDNPVRTIEEAVEACYGGYVAKARKAGRHPQWPYVPIVEQPCSRYGRRTTQVPKRAYATADEAVACAQRWIDAYRAKFASDLANPRCRALRRPWGVACPA